MGAYNTVKGDARCPNCGNVVEVTCQFKFGDTWQFEYALGDALRWGGNQIGTPQDTNVVVSAIAEDVCPRCGFDGEWLLYLFVMDSILKTLETADGRFDFVSMRRTFLVLPDAQARAPTS